MSKTQNDKTTTLSQALLKFQELVGSIAKDGKNPHFKSKYATLTALQEAIREPLQQAGLIVRQKPTAEGLETIVCHAESGECDAFVTPIVVGRQNDAQAYGSGITYARRYALGSYFNLIVDEDDDGTAASKQPRSNQSGTLKMTQAQYNKMKQRLNLSNVDKAFEWVKQFGEDDPLATEFKAEIIAVRMDAEPDAQ
jgi:hypothetical protein